MKLSTTDKSLRSTNESHFIVHTSAVGLGSLSVGLSSGALATALTGFGIVASPALAGVATICGLGSVGFAAASKRLERKVTKHEKIYTLAQAKRNSVNELVSKALADKQISDVEFRIITREVEKYHELKAAIRAGKVQRQEAVAQTTPPDIKKLEEEIRKEVKREFQKKDQPTHRSLQVQFKRMNSGFELYISRTKHTN